MRKITIDGGKYTLVNELSGGGGFRALRYGEEWRSLSGDGMVLAMYHEIERLQIDTDSTFEQAIAAEVALESSRAEVERLKAAYEDMTSIALWSTRRLHKTHKEFAYDAIERNLGEGVERI